MPKTTKPVAKKEKTLKPKFTYAVGRRKTASARIRLFKGRGEIIVNDKPIGQYFSGKVAHRLFNLPFEVTETAGKFDATVKVVGSGLSAQLGAVVHGLARALDKEYAELYHTPLKKAGLLTRDPRERERRKVGLGGKARRHKQSPKR
jgi:small subunit ribosomal protein S9